MNNVETFFKQQQKTFLFSKLDCFMDIKTE